MLKVFFHYTTIYNREVQYLKHITEHSGKMLLFSFYIDIYSLTALINYIISGKRKVMTPLFYFSLLIVHSVVPAA